MKDPQRARKGRIEFTCWIPSWNGSWTPSESMALTCITTFWRSQISRSGFVRLRGGKSGFSERKMHAHVGSKFVQEKMHLEVLRSWVHALSCAIHLSYWDLGSAWYAWKDDGKRLLGCSFSQKSLYLPHPRLDLEFQQAKTHVRVKTVSLVKSPFD